MWNPYGFPGARNAPPIPGQPMVKPEPLDWNLVSILDPEIIQRIKDFDSLQKIITNFSAANFTNGCSKVLAHPLAIRLCQLLQIGFQFMDQSQKELKKIVDDDVVYKQKQLNLLKKLKTKLNATEEKLKIKSVPYDKCPVCSKKFKSIDFVDKHILTKHSEISEYWDVVRGRKKPEKEPELQQVLDEIVQLRSQLKERESMSPPRSYQSNDEYIQQLGLFNNKVADHYDEESLIKHQQLDEAVNELGNSMRLWNAQKEQASSQFNIFNRPSNFVPPEMDRPLFVKEEDISNVNDSRSNNNMNNSNESDDNQAFALFAPLEEEKVESTQINSFEEDSDDDDMPLPPSLGLPDFKAQLDPEQPQRLFQKDPTDEKEKVIKKAQKLLLRQEKSVLQTAKKSQIDDAIDMVKRQEKQEVKRFINGLNGDSVTPSYVRRNLNIDDPDYHDFKNYIQSQLENEYPLDGVEPMPPHPAPKVVKGTKTKPMEFDLVRTGLIPDRSLDSDSDILMNTVSIQEEKSSNNIQEPDELASFSYESIEPSKQDSSMSKQSKQDSSISKQTKHSKQSIIQEEKEEKETDEKSEKKESYVDENHTFITTTEHIPDIPKRESPQLSISEEPLLDLPKEEKNESKDDYEYTYEYYSDTDNLSALPAPSSKLLTGKSESDDEEKESNDGNSLQSQSQNTEGTSQTTNETAIQSSTNFNGAIISPIPKHKSPVNQSIQDIVESSKEDQNITKEMESPIKELDLITKSPPTRKEDEPITIEPPKEASLNLSQSKSPKSQKRNSVLRSSFVKSPAPSRKDVDENNFLMSPPPPSSKKYSPLSSISVDKKSSPPTPKRDEAIKTIKPVEQIKTPAFADDDEFEFEDLPKHKQVVPSFLSSPKSPSPPHISLSPSAASPVKRRKMIQEQQQNLMKAIDDAPPPRQETQMSVEDISNDSSDSMIEGSFTTNEAIVNRSIDIEQADSNLSGFSIDDSNEDDSLLSGSPIKMKKKVAPPKSKPKPGKKLSPRREKHQDESDLSFDELSSGQLSESDGQFDITEELRKLDEDVMNNRLQSVDSTSSDMKNIQSNRKAKPRLSERPQNNDDQSSFLLRNRVSILSDRSKVSDTSFSIMPSQSKDSEENVSLLDGARRIKRTVTKKKRKQ